MLQLILKENGIPIAGGRFNANILDFFLKYPHHYIRLVTDNPGENLVLEVHEMRPSKLHRDHNHERGN